MKNPILLYGIGSGFLIAVFSTLSYFLKLDEKSAFAILLNISSYALLFMAIFVGALQYRKQENNNKATYGEAYGWCAQVVLFAAMTIGLFTLVYFILDPSAKELIVAASNAQIESNEMSEEQAEMAMKVSEWISNPFAITLSAFCAYGVVGLMLSLVAAVFVRNEKHKSFDPINTHL